MSRADDAAGGRTFLAPAKLNLFLHVTGRRADGYHLLQTAMRMVDLGDALTVAVRDDGTIVRAGDVPGVAPDDDLTIRAARLLRGEAGVASGATIALRKVVPMGGGLGGGSSDAAIVLLALNRLWGVGWPRARLATLGARLGADVPFFVHGRDAFVEGIGERITPIDLPEAHYVIVHPGVGVPTAAIFGASELTRNRAPIKIADFSTAGSGSAGSIDVDFGTTVNDLEPVATARFPAVREALAWLTDERFAGASGPARMSGSGACVFRAFDRASAAAAVAARVPGGWSAWSVRSLASHPDAAWFGP